MKIGDGSSKWSELPYVTNSSGARIHLVTCRPYQIDVPTYSGSEFDLVLKDFEPDIMELSGDLKATAAGNYTAIVHLKDGFAWDDTITSEDREIHWVVERLKVTKDPTMTLSYTWSGKVITPTWTNFDATIMTKDGDISGTAAGNYTAMCSIDSNHAWIDGTHDTKVFNWGSIVHLCLFLQSKLIQLTTEIRYNLFGTSGVLHI